MKFCQAGCDLILILCYNDFAWSFSNSCSQALGHIFCHSQQHWQCGKNSLKQLAETELDCCNYPHFDLFLVVFMADWPGNCTALASTLDPGPELDDMGCNSMLAGHCHLLPGLDAFHGFCIGAGNYSAGTLLSTCQ